MNQESVVYGCIKDMPIAIDAGEADHHRERNKQVLASLPSVEDWPLINREMFSMSDQITDLAEVRTDVMHFGTSYKGVEYEWQQWITTFESILKNMYWVSATVHLETELNGQHTFTWEAQNSFHEPGDDDLAVRCEWSRESSFL